MNDLFNEPAVKRCKLCREVKPIEDFYITYHRRVGRRYVHSYCKPCHRKKAAKWGATPRGIARRRAGDLRRTYGITTAEYAAMLAGQNGVCAICRRPEKHRHYKSGELRQLVVDHCHRTGRVRGLLCSLCNRAISLFHDDPLRLRAAADYVESAQGHEG